MIADACLALKVTAMNIFARTGASLAIGFVACIASCLSLKVCIKGWIYLFDIEAGIFFNIPLSKKKRGHKGISCVHLDEVLYHLNK